MVTLYRITGSAVPDFFLGTFLLALLTVFAGELTASIAYRLNRKHLRKLSTRMVEMNNASMAALETGRKGEYRARNKEANDAFGRVFFNASPFPRPSCGRSSSLWPGCSSGLRASGSRCPSPACRPTTFSSFWCVTSWHGSFSVFSGRTCLILTGSKRCWMNAERVHPGWRAPPT